MCEVIDLTIDSANSDRVDDSEGSISESDIDDTSNSKRFEHDLRYVLLIFRR